MRRFTAMILYRLAYWLYPDSAETNRFLQKMLWNQLLHSESVVLIDPKKMYKPAKGGKE